VPTAPIVSTNPRTQVPSLVSQLCDAGQLVDKAERPQTESVLPSR
jgi:hypothetical protein